MGLLSSGAKAAAKNAVSDAGLLSPGIRAYHGSPHDFDSFSTSQIGTGEGAQAYGRGLYFAEREGTAKAYRKALKGRVIDIPGASPELRRHLGESFSDSDFFDVEAIPDDWWDYQAIDLEAGGAKDLADELRSLDKSKAKLSSGSMYEVNIDATPDQFIDWDLPLDEQSESVMSALKKTDWYEYAEEGAYNAAERRGDNAYGMDLVRWLEEDGAEDAAQMLKDAGIKGVQYADAQTRFGKGPKTKNFVVYDDKLIDITKKYGISVPLAAAVAAGTMTPEQAQAGPLSAGARRIIGPRFSQPVAGGSERKAVRGALETMQTDIEPRPMNVGSPVTLQDYEGYPYMLTQSDRSAAGGMLTGIHGQSIDPVNLQGGRDFMFDPQSENLVWASDPNVVKTMYKRAMELREKFGKDPILLPYTMAPTGIDFARMPLDTMINYARQGMSKANIKKLDSQIKKVIPGWTSVMDPEVNAMFRDVGGNQRKMIANIIDKNFRDVPGGLSMGEARAATSDIAQYTSPDGSLLNVGRIDTSQAPIADSGHSTYKGGLVGKGIGRLTEDLDVRPFMAARGRELTGGPEDIRSLSMNPAFSQGVVDEKLLRNVYDTQGARLQEIATKYGVSIPVAAMTLMSDAEEASASDGGMGVQVRQPAEDEIPRAPDLPAGVVPAMAGPLLSAPGAVAGGLLGPVQNDYGLNLDNVIGMADAGVNAAAGMIAPVLSAPGAVARYAADRYIPGVNFSADDMANARKNTESFFDYQPKTQQGQQFSNQGMQALGGLLGPVANAADDSYIINAFKKGFGLLDRKEQELLKALTDMSPI